MGRFDGKVVFVTGAARGQGRSHAVHFAREGADVIAVDLCDQITTVPYPLATPGDLDETASQVEALDRRIVALQADVRDHEAMQHAFDQGLAELGRIDFVLPNAGIGALAANDPDPVQSWNDVIDTNLTGVWNTIRGGALPALVKQGDGGSVVITSSTAGLKGVGGSSGGGEAYTASKHALVGLMRNFAVNYAQHDIRFNTVHPTGVATPLIMNEYIAKLLTESPDLIGATANLLPIEVLQSQDITHAIAFLCSDDARYITGVALPVDAGFSIK